MNAIRAKDNIFRFFAVTPLLISLLYSPNITAFKYQFQTIGTTSEDAISGVTIKQIVQDKHGYVWIATTSGLNRFDGVRNQQFLESDPIFNISDNDIRALTIGNNGNLWLLNRKSVEFTNNNLEFTQIINLAKYFDNDEISSIQGLEVSKNGEVWLKSWQTLYVFDSSGQIKSRISLPKGLHQTKVWSIKEFFLTQDKVWVLTSLGFWFYDLNKERWHQESSWSNNLKNETNYTHLFVNKEQVAITTQSGISIISTASLKEESIFSYKELNLITPINQLVKNSRQEIWGSSTSGLYRLSKEWENIFQYNYPEQLNIKSPDVNTLHFDRQDNLWIGSAFDGVRVIWDIAQAFNIPETLSNENISAVTSYAEKLFIGTYLGELIEYTPSNNYASRIALQLNKFIKVKPPINEVVVTKSHYWLGTAQGLFIHDKETQQTQQWLVGKTPNFPFNSIMDIHQDKYGDIWVVGERGGIISINQETLSYYNLTQKEKWKDEYSNLTFMSVTSDDENLYFGTSDGVILAYNHINQLFERHEPNSSEKKGIIQLRRDQNDNLWLVTVNGVILYSPKQRTSLTEVNASDFAQTAFYSVTFDNNGHLWLSGNNSIAKYNILNREKINYNKQQGALSQEFNRASVMFNNKLYFGSVAGLLEAYPQHLEENYHQQGILFDEVHRKTTNSQLVDKLTQKELGSLIVKDNESFTIPLRPQAIATKDQYEIGMSVDGGAAIILNDWRITLPSYQYSVGKHEVKVLFRNKLKKGWTEAFNIHLNRQGSFWQYISFKIALLCFFFALLVFSVAYYKQTQSRFRRELNTNIANLTEQQTQALIKYNKLIEHSYYLLEDIIRASKLVSRHNQSNYEEIKILCDSLIRFGYQLVNGRVNTIKSNLNVLIDNNINKYSGLDNHGIEIKFQNDVKVTNEIYVELVLIFLKTCFTLINTSSAKKVSLFLSRISARRVCLKLTMINSEEVSVNDLLPVQYIELFSFLCKEVGYSCEIGNRKKLIELTLTLPVMQKWRGLFFANENSQENIVVETQLMYPSIRNSKPQESQKLEESPSVIVLGISNRIYSQMAAELSNAFQLSYLESLDIALIQPNSRNILVVELFNADEKFFSNIEFYRKQQYFSCAVIICPPVLLDYYESQSADNRNYIFQSTPILAENIWSLILFMNKEKEFSSDESVPPVSNQNNLIEISTDRFKQKSSFVAQLDEFLEKAHINTHLNVEKIADNMFLSKSQFTRKLRQSTALSPAEYLKLYRLQKAVALLSQGMSVKDTAKVSGFASQSYFATCFKKQFGYSPSQHTNKEALD